MDNSAKTEYTLFKTVDPCHVMIVKQPFMVDVKNAKGKTTSRKPAQYNDTMESIYIEDQKKLDENPKPTPLYIKRSTMLVDNNDPALLEAMNKHSDNIANGGKLFKAVNVKEEELFEIQAFEALDAATSIIMTAKDSELRTLAIDLIGVHEIKTRASALKKKLRMMVSQKNEPSAELHAATLRAKVIAFSEEKSKEERLLTTIALSSDVVYIKGGNKIAWSDSEDIIYTGSQNKDVVREFSNWLKTDEQGRLIYTTLTSKLEKLNKSKP